MTDKFIKNDVKTVNFTTKLVVLIMCILVLLNFKSDTYFNSYIAIIFALLTSISYLIFKKNSNFNFWSNSFLTYTSILTLIIFIHGGRQGAGVFWIFIMPYFIIHLKGYILGRRIILAYFLTILLIFTLSLFGIIELYFQPEFMVVLFFTFIFQNLYLIHFDKRWEEIKESLITSNTKYLSLINNMSLGVVMISPEMKVIEKNKVIDQWFPGNYDEKVNYCYDCLNLNTISDYCIECKTSDTFKSGKPNKILKSKKTALGWRDFAINTTPLMDNQGNIYAVIETLEDVTEQNIADKAIKESEEKYKLLSDVSTEGIVIHKMGLVIDVNKAFCKLTGYDKDEIIGKNGIELLVHPDSLEIVNENLIKEQSSPFEIKIIRKDGTALDVEVEASIFSQQDKNVRITAIRDLTFRKLSELKIRESEAKLKAVFESANIGISITDTTGKYILFNKWWLDFLKQNSHDLKNLSNLDITHDDDKAISSANFMKVVNGELSNYRIEKKYKCSDGSVVWGDLSVASMKDINGKVENLVGMVVDITGKKTAEERLKKYSMELEQINEQLRYSKEIIETNLQQKNILIEQIEKAKAELELSIKEKDKFFSILAHDLKNPLGSFRNMTKLLYENPEEFTLDERNELLSLIKESADNVYSLLENLLEWSRTQRGKIQFHPESVMLYQIVNLTTDIYKFIAENKNISITNNIPKFTTVIADTQMLNSIFRNLISNAIKFTQQGGNIEIGIVENNTFENSFITDKNLLTIYISDSGIGINKDTKKKLFHIDENITTKGTSGEAGTGLGLILCKEFIEKHGGQIWVESEEFKGSTFFITLPK